MRQKTFIDNDRDNLRNKVKSFISQATKVKIMDIKYMASYDKHQYMAQVLYTEYEKAKEASYL